TGETYPKSDLFNKAPVSCLAHYQQSPEAEKIAQSIILNGIRCQIQ
ncbi:hypothetical protein ACMWMK_22460, partial [Escherichia coli]